MKKTYRGSCHCGAVRFECELDLAAGTNRCNCSFCRKARFWMALVPTAELRVLAGADALVDYQHTPATLAAPFLHLHFCRTCGIRPFTRGGVLPGYDTGFYAVNLGCLDDATDAELAAAPIRFVDGRHDNWETPATESRYL